ncbi:MAG: hypothetical protein B7733_19655 [Myxococcales bacterium FL481]|nr:MAG: hypothetical protein B7733_19655 [Myxococcales bacterium FL481]
MLALARWLPTEDWSRAAAFVDSLLETYAGQLVELGPTLLMVGVLGALVASLSRRPRAQWPPRWVGRLCIAAFVGCAIWGALLQASCVDDAFISFRYARNLVSGHGLVYNPGEYVEGYTNFLWTVGLAGLHWITGVELPLLGILSALGCLATTIVLVARLGATVHPHPSSRPATFPSLLIAPGLLALQPVFIQFGTTGLETAGAAALVCAGALHLGRLRHHWDGLAAGTAFILATLTRPDHGIFYAAGAVVVIHHLVAQRRPPSTVHSASIWRRWFPPRLSGLMLAYVAPFGGYLIYLAWKVHYYGDIFPNTYYAKSAGLSYFSQGLVYAVAFYCSSHLWVGLVLLVPYALVRFDSGAARRFRGFFLVAFLTYNVYIARVGGDFMHGRFYVSLIPLLLVALQQLLAAAQTRRPTVGAVFTAATFATAVPANIFGRGKQVEMIANEGAIYPVRAWSPVTVSHPNFRVARAIEPLQQADPPIILATSGIGAVGYYSGLEIIDVMGLTDAATAHRELPERTRPGHEKRASIEYLHQRGVHIARYWLAFPAWLEREAQISWLGGKRSKWFILRYDREVMREIRRLVPGAKFRDFERYLDRYIRGMSKKPRSEVEEHYRWFKRYYFDHNDDPKRQGPFEALLARGR